MNDEIAVAVISQKFIDFLSFLWYDKYKLIIDLYFFMKGLIA